MQQTRVTQMIVLVLWSESLFFKYYSQVFCVGNYNKEVKLELERGITLKRILNVSCLTCRMLCNTFFEFLDMMVTRPVGHYSIFLIFSLIDSSLLMNCSFLLFISLCRPLTKVCDREIDTGLF